METPNETGAEPAPETGAEGLGRRVGVPPITTASVRVMRSFDYCHFEVVLGTEGEPVIDCRGLTATAVAAGLGPVVGRGTVTTAAVDALRKEAMRLCDHAVDQFKVAKHRAQKALSARDNLDWLRDMAVRIGAKPEGEWTPEEKGHMKALRDAEWEASRPAYDYEEEGEA